MDLTPAVLVVLAVLDGTLAGFRDAAGRNPFIEKRRYYVRAQVRGFFHGLGAALVGGLTVGAVLLASPAPEELYAALLRAGHVMLWVYLPYSVVVLGALGIYVVPSFEIRTLTTVIVLGPGTLLRPVFIAAGAAAAVLAEPRWDVAVPAVVASLAVGLVGRLLARRWRPPRPGEAPP